MKGAKKMRSYMSRNARVEPGLRRPANCSQFQGEINPLVKELNDLTLRVESRKGGVEVILGIKYQELKAQKKQAITMGSRQIVEATLYLMVESAQACKKQLHEEQDQLLRLRQKFRRKLPAKEADVLKLIKSNASQCQKVEAELNDRVLESFAKRWVSELARV